MKAIFFSEETIKFWYSKERKKLYMVLNSNMGHVRIKYHVQFFTFFAVSEFYSVT